MPTDGGPYRTTAAGDAFYTLAPHHGPLECRSCGAVFRARGTVVTSKDGRRTYCPSCEVWL